MPRQRWFVSRTRSPTSLPAGSAGRLMDPNYRNPITEEFNGGYSWAINPNLAVEAEYTHVLAHVLHRPAVLPVPSLGPRLLLGAQGARELACASQRAIPDRLNHSGHRFRQPDLDRALRHLLGRTAA